MIRLLHAANLGGEVVPAGRCVSVSPELAQKLVDAGNAEYVKPSEEKKEPEGGKAKGKQEPSDGAKASEKAPEEPEANGEPEAGKPPAPEKQKGTSAKSESKDPAKARAGFGRSGRSSKPKG